ncbi:hypothetical protein LAZ67_4002144 [Cordylochernes scorpioides]|uniref:Reverse transcriptase RNase H-like domain-containing protein n=1 Tax=Cordylochernes scorpioides TaxID=51811 RepID=A0ABY6KFM5_9ARAC|nr:hypothetical protein LAZ67_4002144 [Cordylochernes scorpioides]
MKLNPENRRYLLTYSSWKSRNFLTELIRPRELIRRPVVPIFHLLMVETRSGKIQDPAQERIMPEESAKPQPGATIGGDASSDPVVLNPNINIPKYDGTEDPRPWIESLEEIGFLYHWADYIISRYAAMNMIGSAKTWLNLHKISFTSWEIFKSRLIQDFASDANKEEMKMRLNRMQQWNEPAIRFAEDILVLCNKVDPQMEEETKINWVIGGLKKEYSFALHLNPPKNTNELLEICKKLDLFEKNYQERAEKSKALYNGPRSPRPHHQEQWKNATSFRRPYQNTSKPQAPAPRYYQNTSKPQAPAPRYYQNTSKPQAPTPRVRFLRIVEEDPIVTQDKVEEEIRMDNGTQKSRPLLYADKMNAKIDCQREIIKYDLTENRDVIKYQQKKIKSATDAIIPELSIKLINAFVEAEDGEYIIEENHKMFQTNGLRLARSLINVVNKETYIWITNPYPRPLKIFKNQTLCFGSQPAEVNLMEESEQKEHEEPQFQINENLAYKEKEQLKQVLERYEDLFSSGLGRSNLAKHRIDTEGAKPIKHKPYRVSAKEREIIKEQIDEMLRDGIIRPSSSPWSFPVILVKKRDGFSKIADPLTSLIKKNVPFTWTENQEKAFQTLKVALINPPILGHFDPNAITYIHTDASNIGLGATLVQKFGDKEKVISYLSRTLSKPEQNFSTTEKECLAVVWSMSKLRPYLYGRHFKIVTDHHALCWLKNLKDPTGRLARWALKIQEYKFEIIHKSGKKHLDADGLSRGPLPENEWDEDYERLFLNQIIDEKDDFIENIKENLSGNKRSITQNYKEENGCLYKKNPNPEDDENIPTDSNMDDYDEYIENYLDKIARTRQVVINNTEKTQERMKRNYDKKHNEKIYEPGHLVAVWTPVRKIGKCEKLLRKYFGPYRILKKLSNVNYLIEPKDNPGQDPLIVHVSRLKPYFERIDEVFWIVFDFYLLKTMDQRTCIIFCVKNEIKCADAFRMLTVACGEATLDRSNVYRWYKMFSEGREDVNDEERAGRPSTSTTDEKINEVEKMILANRRITVREVAENLNISIGSCHSIFINDLGMRRVAEIRTKIAQLRPKTASHEHC